LEINKKIKVKQTQNSLNACYQIVKYRSINGNRAANMIDKKYVGLKHIFQPTYFQWQESMEL